jgi:hypothetical protein
MPQTGATRPVGSAAVTAPASRGPRGSGSTGIASTERVVLGLFGAVTAFAGFVVLLVPAVYGLFRALVGLPVVATGTIFCWLAVRPVGSDVRPAVATRALLPWERASLVPIAGGAAIGVVMLVFRSGLTLWVRFPLLLSTLASAILFGGVIIGNRLPERGPQPDREVTNTAD